MLVVPPVVSLTRPKSLSSLPRSKYRWLCHLTLLMTSLVLPP